MALKLGSEKAWIFRITHRENVPWTLRNGLHCQSSDQKDPAFVSIGNQELIAKRDRRTVPIHPGGFLSDYVPFYFTPASVVMYNIKTGFRSDTPLDNTKIVIMVASLREIVTSGVQAVFTDRHALLTTARFFSSLDGLEEVDWALLRQRDFRHDPERPDKKERYQAEALIYRHLPIERLAGIVCYGESEMRALEGEAQEAQVQLRFAIRPNWYF